MSDRFDLQRFVTAQAPVWPQVRAELAAGAKRGHWMWFVFPQFAGLGRSDMARHYGIRSLDEARAYAQHPLLGVRLLEACALVEAMPPGAVPAAFGPVDALKVRSCLTLFERAVPEQVVFGRLIDQHLGGERCDTTARLGGASPESPPCSR